MAVRKAIDIEEIISKGAPVKEDAKKDKKEWTHMCLRIPTEYIDRIDQRIKDRPGLTRTAYVLEALADKFNNEKI